MNKRKKEITEYYKKCPHCKKEITGFSESQVKYNLEVHIRQKHPDIDLLGINN